MYIRLGHMYLYFLALPYRHAVNEYYLTTVVGEPARAQVEGWADVENVRVRALTQVWDAKL